MTKKKKILISTVSNADPYRASNYGALASIIRYYKEKGEQIDEIYIYLSFDYAVSECINHYYEATIKHICPDAKLMFLPNKLIEQIKPMIESIPQEELNESSAELFVENPKLEKAENDKISLNTYSYLLRKKGIKNANINAHVFGNLYEELAKLIKNIRNNNKPGTYELIFNVTSGTPAMQSDLSLVAITNKDIETKIVQVSDNQNSTLNLDTYDVSEEKFNELDKEDYNQLSKRVNDNVMIQTKKLILLDSIKSSLKKYDFTTIYDNINFYKEIIDNKKIIIYAKNLKYRYVGNTKKAEEEVINKSIDSNLLYPIYDGKEIVANRFVYLIERLNMLKIKHNRDEISDWLLLAENTIESLYRKIIYHYWHVDIDDLKNKNSKDKKMKIIGISQLDKNDDNSYKNLIINDKPISEYNIPIDMIKYIVDKCNSDKFDFTAFNTYQMIKTLKNGNQELIDNLKKLDKIRSIRNKVAHDEVFVTANELDNLYYKDNQYNLSACEDVENAIKNILEMIVPKVYLQKQSGKQSLFEQSLEIYEKIGEEIVALLDKEIYK